MINYVQVVKVSVQVAVILMNALYFQIFVLMVNTLKKNPKTNQLSFYIPFFYSGKCINTEKSYKCECLDGFRLDNTGQCLGNKL